MCVLIVTLCKVFEHRFTCLYIYTVRNGRFEMYVYVTGTNNAAVKKCKENIALNRNRSIRDDDTVFFIFILAFNNLFKSM